MNSRRLKNNVFELLIKFAPNGLTLDILQRHLPDNTVDDLEIVLNALIDEGRIVVKPNRSKTMPDRVRDIYELVDPYAYPITETIMIGDTPFPRLFIGDLVTAEDYNQPFEALAAYDSQIEKRFDDLTTDMTRRYWVNLATLFGLFISIFALILRASEPIAIDASTISANQLFMLKVAQIAPLAVVLLVFVISLRFLLRRF